jgi:hypothetical protein
LKGKSKTKPISGLVKVKNRYNDIKFAKVLMDKGTRVVLKPRDKNIIMD